MSLKKQYLKSKPVCKTTFSLDKEFVSGADKVELLGDFNNWDAKQAISLKKLKNGTFKATLDLPSDVEFQFKYLLNNEKWINDNLADKYEIGGLGQQNSVVIL